MNEVWKDVAGYEDYYEVSSLGNARRKGAVKNLSPLNVSTGYIQVGLSVNGNVKRYLMHRLVAIAFIENRQNKREVNHINGLKDDNRIENLEWVTSRENHLHSVKIGLSNFASISGENSACSKLTRIDVLEIRKIRGEKGTSYKKIGDMYNVTWQAIYDVVKFRNWKHVPQSEEINK